MATPQREQVTHITGPGGVVYSPASPWAKEMAKWETSPREDGSVTMGMIREAKAAGLHMGTFEFKEFPRPMYHATQTPTGIKIDRTSDGRYATVSVANDEEQRRYESRGWSTTEAGAIAIVEADNQAMAEAAANRAYHDRRMSETARREADAIDSTVARHLGEIPEAKRPGRRKKIEVPA